MNNYLTNRQVSLMLYSAIFQYGVIVLPRKIAEAAGTGGWFSLLIATIIFCFFTYMITYLQYVYENETLYEYGEKLVGKSLLLIFIVIQILYFFIFFTMIIRMYSEIIKLIILNKTPVIALCILFYIVVCYALMKGINTIARLCEIYGFINMLSFIIITALIATKGKFVNIQPLFFMDDLMTYLKALQSTILPFLGIEVLFFLPIRRKENKNIFKYTILMVGLIGILYIFIVEASISVVGVDAIIYYKLALFSIVKGTDISSLELFRRLDGIFIIFWSMNIISGMCLLGYGTTTFINKIVKNIKYNYIVIIIVFLSLILSQIPKTSDQIELIMKYNSYLGLVVSMVMPTILFVITKVKKYAK